MIVSILFDIKVNELSFINVKFCLIFIAITSTVVLVCADNSGEKLKSICKATNDKGVCATSNVINHSQQLEKKVFPNIDIENISHD